MGYGRRQGRLRLNELEVKVKEIIPRTYNAKSFRLDTAGSFKAGQFLFVTVKTDKEITKPLSISNSPTEEGYIEFTKKITDSEFSRRLDSLVQGDSIKIKYPFGNFTFVGGYPKIAFLSGGIGITPVRSICKYVVDKKLGTDIILLYSNRTTKDIVFGEDFDLMQKGYPMLKVVHILSETKSEWKGRTGYINSQIIKEEIPHYIERKFYICGHPAMVSAMKGILINELILPKENIITENFVGY